MWWPLFFFSYLFLQDGNKNDTGADGLKKMFRIFIIREKLDHISPLYIVEQPLPLSTPTLPQRTPETENRQSLCRLSQVHEILCVDSF